MSLATIQKRVRALEQSQPQNGRIITAFVGGPVTSRDIDAALASRGIERTAADDLVVFITKYETQGGGIDPAVRVHSVQALPKSRKAA